MKGYNVNVGVPTTIKSLLETTTYHYHPYGLKDFRKSILSEISKMQKQGLEYKGHDQLTHAWRTPWDTHIRYPELMGIIHEVVVALAKQNSPNVDWILTDCWISEYSNNSGANKHNHGESSYGWSFCYYVEVPDEGPGFVLFDRNDMINLNVTSGDLLMFRHLVDHQVFPTLGKRVIISGNLYPLTENDNHYATYLNPEYLNGVGWANTLENNEVDPDNWEISIIKQKLGLNVGIR